MLKKVMALLLALVMVFALCACGGDKKDEKQPQQDDDIVIEEDTDEEEEEEPEVLEEMSLVDNDDITIRITGVDPKGDWGYTLKVFFENKTDKNLMFSVDDASVNGVMCDPFFATEISAGKKANNEITFANDELTAMGIDEVTKIEFTMSASDSEDWTADALYSQYITVHPMGENAVEDYVRTPAQGETVVFDTDDCTMIITGTDPDDFWGYAVKVYMYNKTDKTLMFSVDEGSINGFECDPLWAFEVTAGKHAITNITWFEEDFEENDITDVESIELTISVSDADDWMADDLVNETIEFAPF